MAVASIATYEDFRRALFLEPTNELTQTIEAYVDKNKLRAKNWDGAISNSRELLTILGGQNYELLAGLIAAICADRMRGLVVRKAGGNRRLLDGTVLKKKERESANREYQNYLTIPLCYEAEPVALCLGLCSQLILDALHLKDEVVHRH